MKSTDELTRHFQTNSDAVTEAQFISHSDRFCNQVGVERLLAELRTWRSLSGINPSNLRGAGAVAQFLNAIILNPRHILAVRTSLEAGTVLPDRSITMVEWETAPVERLGHWRGVWPIIVGKPRQSVPSPIVEQLDGPKMQANDMLVMQFAEPLFLQPLPPRKLKEAVGQYGSPIKREDIIQALMTEQTLLARIMNHLARKTFARNMDRRCTERDDITSMVKAEVIEAIDRYSSPARDDILNAGTLSTYLYREVPKRASRDTAVLAGTTTRKGEMLSRMRQADVDTRQDSPETIAQKLKENHGIVASPEQVQQIVAVDRVSDPASLEAGLRETNLSLGEVTGYDDDGYVSVDDGGVSNYEQFAGRVLIGSGVSATPRLATAIAKWFQTLAVTNFAAPTQEDFEDIETGWSTAAWVFTPLLRKHESWDDPASVERFAARFQSLAYRPVGDRYVALREPGDIKKMWLHYQAHEQHQDRDAFVPAGVCI